MIVPKFRGDLLNLTVRSVNTDNDTFLRYADRDMFALVSCSINPAPLPRSRKWRP